MSLTPRKLFLVPPFVWTLLAILFCFSRLVVSPGDLLVDGTRASVDDAVRPGHRVPGNDLTRLFLPLHERIGARIVKNGHLPLWDPAGFGGRPLVGNPQAGMAYPPVWLAWWSRQPSALCWITLGHLIWGALGVYFFCRGLGPDPWSSAVAAGCFALSPYLLAQIYEGHYPHVWTASWYPWAFLLFERFRRGARGAMAGLSLILALAFLTGHLQEWFYLIIAMSLWLLVSGIHNARTGKRGEAILQSMCWIGVVGLTLGLVSLELIPDARAQSWALRGNGFSLKDASRYHISPINLLQLLNPGALGGPADYFGHDNYWETILGFGWVALILAVLSLGRSPRRVEVRCWSILVLASIWFAAGRRLGFFAFMVEIFPGFNQFRVPSRSLFLANLGVAVLVGLGLEAVRLVDLAPVVRRYWRVVGCIAVFLGTTLVVGSCLGVGYNTPSLFRQTDHSAHLNRERELARWLRGGSKVAHDPTFWTVCLGTGAILLWMTGRPSQRQVGVRAIGLLALAELTWYGHSVIQTTPVEDLLGTDPVAAAIHRLHTAEPFRIRARDAFYNDLRAVHAGLEKTNLNDYFQLAHAADMYETLYPLFESRPLNERSRTRKARAIREDVLDRMNVAFLVTDRREPGADWPIAAEGMSKGKPFWLYRNDNVLPRAYVVPRARLVSEGPETLDQFPVVPSREAVLMPFDPLGNSGTKTTLQGGQLRRNGPRSGSRDGQNTLAWPARRGGHLDARLASKSGWYGESDISRESRAARHSVASGRKSRGGDDLPSPRSEHGNAPFGDIGDSLPRDARVREPPPRNDAVPDERFPQTQPCRLRSHHSSVSRTMKSRKKGQLSQSRTSFCTTDSVMSSASMVLRYAASCSGGIVLPPVT